MTRGPARGAPPARLFPAAQPRPAPPLPAPCAWRPSVVPAVGAARLSGSLEACAAGDPGAVSEDGARPWWRGLGGRGASQVVRCARACRAVFPTEGGGWPYLGFCPQRALLVSGDGKIRERARPRRCLSPQGRFPGGQRRGEDARGAGAEGERAPSPCRPAFLSLHAEGPPGWPPGASDPRVGLPDGIPDP